MNQLVHSACAATTWTSETSKESKHANGKEAGPTRFKQKKVRHAGKQGGPDANYRQTTVPKSWSHGFQANTNGSDARMGKS